MRILLCLGCDVLLILSKKAYKLIFDCLKYNRYICNKFYKWASWASGEILLRRLFFANRKDAHWDEEVVLIIEGLNEINFLSLAKAIVFLRFFIALPHAVQRSFDGYQAIDWRTSNDRLMPSERFPKYYQNSFPITVDQACCLLTPALILSLR